MRDQLLGYLLGALEPHEHEAFELRLADDEGLRQDLERLRAGLPWLDDRSNPLEPPGGLAQRTCRWVQDQVRHSSAPLHHEPSAAGVVSFRMPDLFVVSGVALAALLLFFPAVASSRFHGQVAVCKDNLRSLGASLWNYSLQHRSFPAIPLEGNMSVVGAFAPTLAEAGYLENSAVLVCPGSRLAQAGPFQMPCVREILAAHGERLHRCRQQMAGSYGYHPGHVEDGEYRPTRNQARPQFPILADAPGDQPASGSTNHGPCGQSVLFEDGHVEFVKQCRLELLGENIFCNDSGQWGAGLSPHDASLSPSSAPPVSFLRIEYSPQH
jgi:hypothetical protein